MARAVIAGVGIHPFGRFPGKSYADIALAAARDALRDADMEWSRIRAAYVASMYLPPTSGPRVLRGLGSSDVPVCDIEAACASGGVALRQALLGIEAGAFDAALVVGVEKMAPGFMDPAMIYERWQIEAGLSVNPCYWALHARRHMHDFGTTERQIAAVAYKNHGNSEANPDAMYRRRFSMEEILSSPLICDPLRLFEVCSPNEGAAAVVVKSAESSSGANRNAVEVAACSHTLARYGSDLRAPADSTSSRLSYSHPTRATSEKAYEQAGIGPAEIDCFEVQDTDAFCEIEAYEQLGLCRVGEGGRLVDDGVTTLSGRSPVNMSGGLISKGEPVGASHIGQIVEIVRQLRGQAGGRQVAQARTGLAHVLGAGGHCAVTILAR